MPQSSKSQQQPTPQLGNLLLVAILLAFDSMHFIFARLMLDHISPGVSVMYVLGVSTIEVGIFAVYNKKINVTVFRKNIWFFAAIGFLIAASTNINYEAVAFIDPGTASLLSQTSVIFGLGFGLLWLNDQFTIKQLAGAFLAIIGVFLVSFQPGDYIRLGSLLVIGSSGMYALHAAITKQHGAQLDFVNFFFFRLLSTTGFLFVFAAGRQSLALPSRTAWFYILLTATVDVALSRALYYMALRRLSISTLTISLTLSPIASNTWAFLLFGSIPGVLQILGGLGIITGVYIVTNRRSKKEKVLQPVG
ncbi:MAG: DMT family transporter [Anaerolineae bacterium]|nr:DMT family transporter [Anaerolineae bacterium]